MIYVGAGNVAKGNDDGISFSPPFHAMCEKRKGFLLRIDGDSDYIVFSEMGIDQLPEGINIRGVSYRYAGVDNGVACYAEVEIDK